MPSEAQIQHILAVASDLVVQYTFNKTTMDDIARQAGLSKSSLYLIWKNKSQLLDALLAYEMKRLLQDFSARLEGDPAGGELAHVVKHALLALQHNPFMRALYTRDAETLGHFVRHQNVQRYTEQWGLSVALVQTMQELQLIDDTLPPALIRHVLTLIEVGFMHIQTITPAEQVPPVEEVAEAVSYLLQHGLARQAADSTANKQMIETALQQAIQQYEDVLLNTARR